MAEMITAKLRYLRIAPRKIRLVANLIRGKRTEEAQTILDFTVKAGALPLLKLLNQAIANAKNNFQKDPANLFISKITVDEGPKYKRWLPRARGQASEIQKKTCHLTLVLDEIKGKAKKGKKAKPVREEGAVEKPSQVVAKVKREKPQFRPELEKPKPKIDKVMARIFRRKAF